MSNSDKEYWVTTAEAIKILNVTRQRLCRYWCDPEKGFLIEGKHWKKGMYFNTTRYFEINRCKATVMKQGYMLVNSA
jgi:hypothetical protein|tara:strand:+ start:251 stop:481 length:231 start_codon:yes stop_codon:yes gene_type:complete